METKKFSGKRIIVGASLYMILMMAVLGLYGPLYGMLSDYFNTDLVVLSLCVTACSILGAVTGIFAGKVLRAFGPRKCMMLGGILAVLFGVVMCFLKGSAVGFAVAMSIAGCICGICSHGCVTDLIMRWYIKKRSVMLGIVMAISMFGVASGQTLGSLLYGMGLSINHIFLVGGGTLGVLTLLVTIFLIRDNPEDLGQVAFGADDPEFMAQMETEVQTPEQSEKKADFSALYKNPVFWCMLIAVCFTNSGASYIAGYLTTFLPTVGVDFSISATFMSVMGYTAAVVMLCSGKIIEKAGVRNFTFLVLAGCFLGNGLLLSLNYSQSALIPILCGVTLGYSFAYTSSNIHNLLCPILFKDRAMATEANTKMIAVMYGGSAIMGPVLSKSIMASGFKAFYSICLVLNVIVTICFVFAFMFAKKRNMVA